MSCKSDIIVKDLLMKHIYTQIDFSKVNIYL